MFCTFFYRGLTFRKEYRTVKSISGLLADAPLLFLTATATSIIQDDILQLFNVKDITTVADIPDRFATLCKIQKCN